MLETAELSPTLESSQIYFDEESPKAKDWQRILNKSNECQKNLFINDSVHGHIKIPALCQAVIDTAQFDRLRGIKQLGNLHYVFPCAKHTRWEHSVGVMHLAGEFINALRHPDRRQPDCCDNRDQLCVMLAGLCHDLGHGPCSHLWESLVAEARPGFHWRHEKTSIDMLDHIIKENNLMPVFESHGLVERDIIFIKELIYGPLEENGSYIGRGPEKHFLYEIVANKISSIDVDKWDYILRDNKAMHVGVTFDYKRFILMSYLKVVNGKTRLVLAEKEAKSIGDLFDDRARLHEHGYQHRVNKKIDRMVLDALLSADKHIDVCYDREGNPVSLSEACNDMYAFSQLTDDYLLNSIRHSRKPELQGARDILHKVATRRLYKIIGTVECVVQSDEFISNNLQEIQAGLQDKIRQEAKLLKPNDVVLTLKHISSGLGRRVKPVERVLFVDNHGQCKNYNEKYLSQLKQKDVEAIYVILRREGDEPLKEGAALVHAWYQQTFDKDNYHYTSDHSVDV